MNGCFRDLVPELRPFIPAALIDDQWLERLAQRVGNLPGMGAALMTALELRLGDPVRAADCAVAVGPGRPLFPYYIRRGETAPANSHAARLGQMLARLRAGAGSQEDDLKALHSVLLEYDVAEVPEGAHPEPGVFLGLQYQPEQAGSVAAATDALVATVGWTRRDVGDAAYRVFEALPRGSGIANIGAMPDREPQAIKMIAAGIATAHVRDFLGRAGWPGSVAQVERVIEAMAPVASRFALSLDVVGQGPLPRLGLEFSPPEMQKGGAAWQPLIERVADFGWCLPEKRRALIGFPGMERVFRDDGLFMLYRGINHVKLTVANDDVQAKAYIGLSYFPFADKRWLPPGDSIATPETVQA